MRKCKEGYDISRFWNKFSSKLKQYGVKADAVLWVVKHAERYIKQLS